MTGAGMALATRPGSGAWRRLAEGRSLPVATVVLIILVLWYAAAIGLNAPQVRDRLNRSGQDWTTRDLVAATWSMERPVLPTPDQIGAEFYKTVFATPLTSRRNLAYHAYVTASATVGVPMLSSRTMSTPAASASSSCSRESTSHSIFAVCGATARARSETPRFPILKVSKMRGVISLPISH